MNKIYLSFDTRFTKKLIKWHQKIWLRCNFIFLLLVDTFRETSISKAVRRKYCWTTHFPLILYCFLFFYILRWNFCNRHAIFYEGLLWGACPTNIGKYLRTSTYIYMNIYIIGIWHKCTYVCTLLLLPASLLYVFLLLWVIAVASADILFTGFFLLAVLRQLFHSASTRRQVNNAAISKLVMYKTYLLRWSEITIFFFF